MSGATDSALADVSCPTTTSCFAVGSSGTTLIERWNGTKWSIVASPSSDPDGGGLHRRRVQVLDELRRGRQWPDRHGARGHRAVERHPLGARESSDAHAAQQLPLRCLVPRRDLLRRRSVHEFQGHRPSRWSNDRTARAGRWYRARTRRAPPRTDSRACRARAPRSASPWEAPPRRVGDQDAHRALERLEVVGRAEPEPRHRCEHLASVSCASATSCFAVGSYAKVGAARRSSSVGTARSGRSSRARTAHPARSVTTRTNRLQSVSCATATSCFAVGYDANDTPGPFLWRQDLDADRALERFGVVDREEPEPGQGPQHLPRVSCPSTNTCFAVGEFYSLPRRPAVAVDDRTLERHRVDAHGQRGSRQARASS